MVAHRGTAFATPDLSAPREWRAAQEAAPIDLAHLARQTFGNGDLQREILSLFLTQVAEVEQRLGIAGPRERRLLAHNLKGSARGIGAFGVADAAEAVERDPCRGEAHSVLGDAIDAARRFILATANGGFSAERSVDLIG